MEPFVRESDSCTWPVFFELCIYLVYTIYLPATSVIFHKGQGSLHKCQDETVVMTTTSMVSGDQKHWASEDSYIYWCFGIRLEAWLDRWDYHWTKNEDNRRTTLQPTAVFILSMIFILAIRLGRVCCRFRAEESCIAHPSCLAVSATATAVTSLVFVHAAILVALPLAAATVVWRC